MKNELAEHAPLEYRVAPGSYTRRTTRKMAGWCAVQIFYNSLLIEELTVPKSEWTILALLIESAKRALETGHRAAAYWPASQLASELRRRTGVGDGRPENVHRAVNKLRTRLTNGEASALARFKDIAWPREVVEHHATLGYRISMPPEALTLVLLDEADC